MFARIFGIYFMFKQERFTTMSFIYSDLNVRGGTAENEKRELSPK